jgi:hypothetical protein
MLCFTLIAFLIYFVISMIVNNPFNFILYGDLNNFYTSNNTEKNHVLDEFVFKNNKGLAFLCLFILTSGLIIWDKFLVKYLSQKIGHKSFSLFGEKLSFLENETYKQYRSW